MGTDEETSPSLAHGINSISYEVAKHLSHVARKTDDGFLGTMFNLDRNIRVVKSSLVNPENSGKRSLARTGCGLEACL